MRYSTQWHKAMVEELDYLNRKPEWFPNLCLRVAEGELLHDICMGMNPKIKTTVARIWIACDETREEMFTDAQKICYENRKDRIQEHLYAAATSSVEITEAGKMRAADMLINPKSSVAVDASGGKITIVHEST